MIHEVEDAHENNVGLEVHVLGDEEGTRLQTKASRGRGHSGEEGDRQVGVALRDSSDGLVDDLGYWAANYAGVENDADTSRWMMMGGEGRARGLG